MDDVLQLRARLLLLEHGLGHFAALDLARRGLGDFPEDPDLLRGLC